MEFSPIIISIKTAAVATVITVISGIAAAYFAAKIKNKIIKGVTDSIFMLPIVLPPTVIGFLLLKFFGINGPAGRVIEALWGQRIIFSWASTVICAVVVAFPLMYRAMRGAFEELDSSYASSAKTLGISNFKIFIKIELPNCRAALIGGTVMSFARALGEFGATMMLAGNIPGKTQTIATAIYSAMAAGNDAEAYRLVALNMLISLFVITVMNTAQKSRKGTA
jgi:molybdate transport system permease protein